MTDFTAQSDSERDQDTSNSSSFYIAVSVSLIAHAALAIVLIEGEFETVVNPAPRTVAVTLLDRNPQQPQVLETESNDILVEAEQEEIDIPEPAATQETSVAQESTPEDIVEPSAILETAQAEEIADQFAQDSIVELPTIQRPAVDLPSVDSVTQSLRQISNQQSTRFYAYDCSPLDEEAGLKECEPQSRSNFEVVERNATYSALNPIRQSTRSQRTLGVVSSASAELGTRLRSEDIPEGLSDYVMEELEAGISHNVNTGNRATQHIIDMTDTSSAAAQAKQVLADGWVLKRRKELQERRVHLP